MYNNVIKYELQKSRLDLLPEGIIQSFVISLADQQSTIIAGHLINEVSICI